MTRKAKEVQGKRDDNEIKEIVMEGGCQSFPYEEFKKTRCLKETKQVNNRSTVNWICGLRKLD